VRHKGKRSDKAIRRPDNQPSKVEMHNRPKTHHTRFERRVDVTFFGMGEQKALHETDRFQLGMREVALFAVNLVPPGCDYGAAMDDNRADRQMALSERLLRCVQRQAHDLLIGSV
jgi:hypothetical protein